MEKAKDFDSVIVRLIENQELVKALAHPDRTGGDQPRMPDFAMPSDLWTGAKHRESLEYFSEEAKADVWSGLPGEVVGDFVDIPISPWADDKSTSHRMPVILAWRSRSCVRLRSQYSGVISIGSPESSPSSNRASRVSSARRF